MKVKMEGVKEYNEEMAVYLVAEGGVLMVEASNEAGFNSTRVDLVQLIKWLKEFGVALP